MDPYIPLYCLGFAWLVFAAIQDFRTREIANWLTGSLIIFGLAYRAMYALVYSNSSFFSLGLAGSVLFLSLAYLLYYSGAFAGGDAKLLIGIGALLPYRSLSEVLFTGLGFTFILFLFGSVYGLIYTSFLVVSKKKVFTQMFKKLFAKYRLLAFLSVALGVIFLLLTSLHPLLSALGIVLIALPFLFIYAKAVEQSCFIVLVSPSKLVEGDWLAKDILLKGKLVSKRVEGLTKQEIFLLRKRGRKVLVRYGVPFAPAFLFALAGTLYAIFRFNITTFSFFLG